jgi:hypothetical protein
MFILIAGSAAYDITFPSNSDTGWVCGMNGHVHKVTPTGVSINYGLVIDNMYSLSFPDSDHGWVCGGAIMMHYYNGLWHQDQTYSFGGWSDIFFLNDTSGWAAGDVIYSSTGLMHTSDGINWANQNNPSGVSMYAILFINENEGWTGSALGTVEYTTDGGRNWLIDSEATSISAGRFITEIFYVPFRHSLYILGNNGLLLKKSSVNGIEPKESNDKNSFSINPNPCRDIFTIQFNNKRSVQGNITVINLLGIKVKELNMTGQKQQLDISDLPEGTYMVFVNDRENWYSGKLIVME